MESLVGLLCFSWIICCWVQMFLGLGSAYRYAKKGGDNGIALFGWMFVFNCAALVPGLGIYFWNKTRKAGSKQSPDDDLRQSEQSAQQLFAEPEGCPVGASPSRALGQACISDGAKMAIAELTVPSEVRSFELACPSCGRSLPSDSRFCEYCGSPLNCGSGVDEPMASSNA